MKRTRDHEHRFQRAAGWCKAVSRLPVHITSELRTDNVGCAGMRPIQRF